LDEEGDTYFHNATGEVSTYDDPRLGLGPLPPGAATRLLPYTDTRPSCLLLPSGAVSSRASPGRLGKEPRRARASVLQGPVPDILLSFSPRSPYLLVHLISLSPYLLISLSPYLLITLSLYHFIYLSHYLKDNGTGETTYEDPREKAAAEAAREAELGPLPRAWEMIYDQHGQLYFQKALPKVPA